MLKYLILIIALLLCSCGGDGITKEIEFTVSEKYEYRVSKSEDPLTSDVESRYRLKIIATNAKGISEFYYVHCNEKTFRYVKEDGRYIGVFQSYWKHYSSNPMQGAHTVWRLRLLEFKGKA